MNHPRLFSMLLVLMVCFALFAPFSPAAAQQDVQNLKLVTDINTQLSDSAEIWCSMNALGKLFMIANDGESGVVLYSSDGTQAGTIPLKVISQRRNADATYCQPAVMGGKLYFKAYDPLEGEELWVTDGTPAGTKRAVTFRSGPIGGNPTGLTVYGDSIYLYASSDLNTNSAYIDNPILMKTDGTQAGTQPVLMYIEEVEAILMDMIGMELYGYRTLGVFQGGLYVIPRINPSMPDSNPICLLVEAGGKCEYVNMRAGTTPLGEFNQRVYFDSGSALWMWDADDGEQQVAMINSGGSARLGNMIASGGWLYFTADDGVHGLEWWRTDGNPDGTTEFVADIAAGGSSISLGQGLSRQIVPFGSDGLLFATYSGSDTQIWAILPGTKTANNILTFDDPYLSPSLATVGAQIFIYIHPYFPERGLWVSDGTASGTQKIYTSAPVWRSQYFTFEPQAYDGRLYFSGSDLQHGWELWKTDGTSAGTQLAVNINTATAGSFPARLVASGGKIFFTAHSSALGRDLWVSDGAAGGSVQQLTNFQGVGEIGPIIAANDKVYFSYLSPEESEELWVSDGTVEGTQLFKVTIPGIGGLANFHLATVTDDGTLYFWTTDISGGYYDTLWKSGGTAETTIPVKTVYNHYSELGSLNNMVIFKQMSTMETCSLWQSDGTSDGTRLLKADVFADFESWELPCHANNEGQSQFFKANHRLFIIQQSATYGYLLVETDGTEAGTYPLVNSIPHSSITKIGSPPVVMQDTLYFVGKSSQGWGLWKTRGFGAGGVQQVMALPNATDENHPYSLAAGEDRFYFLDTTSGRAIVWVSDGTAQGTHAIQGLYRDPQELIAGNGVLFFTAEDALQQSVQHGRELWITDGTSAGTRMVADLNPGPAGSDPRDTSQEWIFQRMISSGERLYISATDGGHHPGSYGAELWLYESYTGRFFLPMISR